MASLETLARFTRRVNRWFLAAAGALVVVMLAVIGYDVVLRNVFDSPTLWALDTSRFLLQFVFFLALAPALEAGSHVSVDILEHYLPATAKRAVRLAARVLVIVFAAILLWQVTRTAWDAFATDELFPIVVSVKLKHVYWIAPLGVLQFLLTGLVMLGREWRGVVGE